jgi:hypothetical protein
MPRARPTSFSHFTGGENCTEGLEKTTNPKEGDPQCAFITIVMPTEPDQGQEGLHRRLRQPGPCPCAEPARFRRQGRRHRAQGRLGHRQEGRSRRLQGDDPVAEAAKWADLMMMLTPDELQGDIYRDELHANMKEGAALALRARPQRALQPDRAAQDLDVLMIAPKGPGHTVRSRISARRRRALPDRGSPGRLGQRP